VVAFIGDYIYEWGPYDLAHPLQPRGRNIESHDLAGYRARYAQYKSDPQLQASHHAAPWILTWDDHEVSNDYGNDRDELLEPNFIERRAAAYQAFYEHMPVRLPPLEDVPNKFAHMRIYDRYDWGKLARFHVLDDRQYRAYQACQPAGRGGSSSVTNAQCPERLDPNRSILGWEQEKWLAHGLANSTAKWNIVTQQTLMAQNSQTPIKNSGDGLFWTDGWDGYPAARQRLLEDIQKHKPANPVVVSGDVHTFYAANLKRDFYEPASASNPIIATEFCGTSITSSSRPQEVTEQYVAQNPHIKFGRSDKRGYMQLDFSPHQLHVRFMALDDVHKPNSGQFELANFIVVDGKPGVYMQG
jgi:alkaline phosphatase D